MAARTRRKLARLAVEGACLSRERAPRATLTGSDGTLVPPSVNVTLSPKPLNDDALFRQLQQDLAATYTIERELGGGGMSRVYLAVEKRFQRRVVIKVLAPELTEGLSSERFEREIGLAAGLQQANIVPVITAGYVNGLPWYSMPFVDGESLRARMERGVIPATESVGILRDIARALAYAHERGIVHRDIKPENVLLSGSAAVVTDFGIAKALSASKTSAPGGTLTQVGTSIGTPAYMAPEQAVGADVDHRADIYSWGVIAYELLSHKHPFAGRTTAQQLIAAHIAETPVALPASTPVATLVARTLSKNPDDRPSSANELLDALNNVVTTGTVVHPAPSIRGKVLAASAGVALVLAVGAYFARQPKTVDTAPDSAAIATIAVLPFVNTGGVAQDEYFSDGMTDELAHALSQLPGLRLAGRTSSFSFKGKAVNATDIGKALDVAGIVEGTVRRSGDRLRVTASLTSTVDGKQRWTNSYESTSKDVFTVQDELTKAMVAALAPALRGEQASNVAERSRGTSDEAAYDDYLKGRHFWQLRGTVNLLRAIENFQSAISRDPKFARAYAGLAMAYVVLPGYMGDPADTLNAAGIRTANRALSLDSTLIDAKLAIAYALVPTQSDSAEARFAEILAKEPENVTARQWHGGNLILIGRYDDAIEELRYATKLDPLSAVVQSNLVYALWGAARLDEAVRETRRVFEIDPDYVDPAMVSSYVFGGQPDSALYHLTRMQRADSSALYIHAMLALSYAAKGRWDAYDSVAAAFARAPKNGSAGEAAIIALVDGDAGPMARVLGTQAGRQEWITIFLAAKCAPLLAPLRGDKRLTAFVSGDCRPIQWPIKPRRK